MTVKRKSEGVKRLGITLGLVGATPGIFVLFGSALVDFGTERFGENMLFGAAFALVGFIVPWALVHTIAWIVRGFRVDRER